MPRHIVSSRHAESFPCTLLHDCWSLRFACLSCRFVCMLHVSALAVLVTFFVSFYITHDVSVSRHHGNTSLAMYPGGPRFVACDNGHGANIVRMRLLVGFLAVPLTFSDDKGRAFNSVVGLQLTDQWYEWWCTLLNVLKPLTLWIFEAKILS